MEIAAKTFDYDHHELEVHVEFEIEDCGVGFTDAGGVPYNDVDIAPVVYDVDVYLISGDRKRLLPWDSLPEELQEKAMVTAEQAASDEYNYMRR